MLEIQGVVKKIRIGEERGGLDPQRIAGDVCMRMYLNRIFGGGVYLSPSIAGDVSMDRLIKIDAFSCDSVFFF